MLNEIRAVKTMVLKPHKNSRTISFEIALGKLDHKIRDFDTLDYIENVYVLSICGGVRKGGCRCQKIDEIISYRDRVRDSDIEIFDFIIDIWKRYHLNDLHAGTKRQEQALAQANHTDRGYAIDYKIDCDYLKQINLFNDNGVVYGHEWLCEIIPQNVIDKIVDLINNINN